MIDVDITGADPTLAELTTELVAAYVTQNHVQAAELPVLIASVHSTLATLGQATAPEPAAEALKPAVPIKKSVTDDYLVSLETGQRFQTLKKHLSGLGMTPAEYRAKWGLPHDYPMVAPSYAAQRSALAKSLGLGRKRKEA